MFSSRPGGTYSSCVKSIANQPSIMGAPLLALPERKFSTTASLRSSNYQRMSFESKCDESRAKVINTENNYPNNERKTSQDLLLEGGALLINAIHQRTVSESRSEDSFIEFEGRDSDLDDLDDSDSNDDCDNDDEEESDQDEPFTIHYLPCTIKKVHFPADGKLIQVHHLHLWAFAARACRKGPWEEHARDRARFNRRIECCADSLAAILQPAHRERIFRERFAATLDESQCGRRQRTQSFSSDRTDSEPKHRHKRSKRHKKSRKKRRRNRYKKAR